MEILLMLKVIIPLPQETINTFRENIILKIPKKFIRISLEMETQPLVLTHIPLIGAEMHGMLEIFLRRD
jgi:hypothetical protein